MYLAECIWPSVSGDLRRELTLRGLGLSGGKLSADCLHSFARRRGALAAIQRCVDQLFQAAAWCGPSLARSRRAAAGVGRDAMCSPLLLLEKLQADHAVVDGASAISQ